MKRWLIYDADQDAIIGPIQDSYEAAVDDANQLHDVLVVPVELPSPNDASGEPESADEEPDA